MYPRPNRRLVTQAVDAMKDKLNITIRLADQPPIALSNITFQEEEVIREAEYNINRLWSAWTKRFSNKTPQEVLAMVTFRFAQLYYQQQRTIASVDRELEQFNSQLDTLIAEIPDVDKASEGAPAAPNDAD